MTIMNRLKTVFNDTRRGAIEAVVGFLASAALLAVVLYGVIFIGQVL
jgi:hypothetical protein